MTFIRIWELLKKYQAFIFTGAFCFLAGCLLATTILIYQSSIESNKIQSEIDDVEKKRLQIQYERELLNKQQENSEFDSGAQTLPDFPLFGSLL